jgi:hypothetical protein
VTEADTIPLDAKKKSTWLVVRIGTTIDDDTIARMKWGEHFLKLDPVRTSPCYFSREWTPFFAEAGVDKLLMIDAMKPA